MCGDGLKSLAPLMVVVQMLVPEVIGLAEGRAFMWRASSLGGKGPKKAT